jgi:hypothetical protein
MNIYGSLFCCITNFIKGTVCHEMEFKYFDKKDSSMSKSILCCFVELYFKFPECAVQHNQHLPLCWVKKIFVVDFS